MARGDNRYMVSGSESQSSVPRPQRATSNPSSSDAYDEGTEISVLTTRIGIYGWKKFCLYIVVLFLIALSLLNIGLIVFLFRVVNLDLDSAGPMHFYKDRVLVRGRAEFQGGITASNISGFDNSTLLVESNQQIILRSLESPPSTQKSTVVLDGINVNVDTPNFQLTYDNTPFFTASPEQTVIASNDIVVESPLGLRIDGSVLVPKISNAYDRGEGLTVESIGQQLTMRGVEDVTMESTTNRVDIKAQQGINLQSTQGDIVLDASNLRLTDLPHNGGSGPRHLCMCGGSKRIYTVVHTSTCSQAASSFC
eukprot:m.16010 g.16010  ORF g.16010 m.16010 type:complete len:309 (+) comp4557_c0_seq1:138-1064(+)